MKSEFLYLITLIISLTLVGCSTAPTPTPTAAPTATPSPLPTTPPTPTAIPPTPTPEIPIDLVSRESLLATLEDLTAIQPYSGWRTSATEGEAEARDYITRRLDEFSYLHDLGLEVTEQSFRVFCTTEQWETRLHLTVGGEEIEVPADGQRGASSDVGLALRFDSDGAASDTERNPVEAEGPIVVFHSYIEINEAAPEDVEGKIVFLDYAAIDRQVLDTFEMTQPIVQNLLALHPAGIVMVTTFSNEPGESHGTSAGDGSWFTYVPITQQTPAIPTLHARMEDMALTGINSWDDLSQITNARITWDADVISPAESANVIARIPGADSSQAMLLGAHVDSPNNPGALDNGSGSAVLLEVARVLNEAQIQPATDLYLTWFGSEEIGLFGSAFFANTHQDLLDRMTAMMVIDMLSHPLDGLNAEITLKTRSYDLQGDDRLLWPDFIAQSVTQWGIDTAPTDSYDQRSDHAAFAGFGVPNAHMIYEGPSMSRYNLAYATHVHDPYDTVDLAREMGDAFEEMTQVALLAVLEGGWHPADFDVTPSSDRRIVFIASHTEEALSTPAGFTDLGQTFAMSGYDVDVIPYGQPVTPADLADADIAVALPLHDYPGQRTDTTIYDETWSEEEIDTLDDYVAGGGLLVLTNSAHRIGYAGRVRDPNEDWRDVNALANRFGVSYGFSTFFDDRVWTEGESPLVEGVSFVRIVPGNGIPFRMETGEVLARSDGRPVIGLVSHGDGEVLVLADLGLLADNRSDWHRITLWQNLAEYARTRGEAASTQ
jgi:hypothetical protein